MDDDVREAFDRLRRELALVRGRVEVLMDAYGHFRGEYQRDHPHPEDAPPG